MLWLRVLGVRDKTCCVCVKRLFPPPSSGKIANGGGRGGYPCETVIISFFSLNEKNQLSMNNPHRIIKVVHREPDSFQGVPDLDVSKSMHLGKRKRCCFCLQPSSRRLLFFSA